MSRDLTGKEQRGLSYGHTVCVVYGTVPGDAAFPFLLSFFHAWCVQDMQATLTQCNCARHALRHNTQAAMHT